jgi:hypothetical protein
MGQHHGTLDRCLCRKILGGPAELRRNPLLRLDPGFAELLLGRYDGLAAVSAHVVSVGNSWRRRSGGEELRLVGAENPIRPGQAASRYSWIGPKTASLRCS